MASLTRKFRTLRNTWVVLGPMTTARAALAEMIAPNYEADNFDQRFGTRTSGLLSVHQSELPPDMRDDAGDYWPVVEPVMHHILRHLPIRYEEFAFIDAGCGKGRALLLASMYPFARIVGVELSPVTADIAYKNIAAFREGAAVLQKCTDINVEVCNVLDYEFPDANVVLFLYNPFWGSVFEAFMRRVHEFSKRTPHRELLVAYCNPWRGDEWLRQCGYFRKTYEHRMVAHRLSWNLWVPATESTHAHSTSAIRLPRSPT